MTLRNSSLLTLLLLVLCSSAFAAPDHWVGTWAASPYAAPNRENKTGAVSTVKFVKQ